MDRSFWTDDSSSSPDSVPLSSPIEPNANRELLRVLLVGSHEGVTSTIQNLHNLGFAEIGEWSHLLPAPNPGEVMSILTRYIAIGKF